jgi:hypothetical protein
MIMQGSLRSFDNSSDSRSGYTSSELSSPKPSSPTMIKAMTSSSSNLMMKPQISRLEFKDGRIFEGEHIGGHMIRGKMYYTDGSVYTGGWMKSKRHGRGVCTFADGSLYEGDFYDGDFHGLGKMTWNDGGWYEGQWRKGEVHGRGLELRSDGSLRHDGVWNKGVPVRGGGGGGGLPSDILQRE